MQARAPAAAILRRLAPAPGLAPGWVPRGRGDVDYCPGQTCDMSSWKLYH
jgi:hypothetical protein